MENQMSENNGNGQVVTFRLGRETYGIEIFKIQEVLNFQKITPVPNAPEFVEGVADVRDRVIPVVDLKRRLMVTEEGEGKRRIVILDLKHPLGIIVDDISKVIMLDASQFETLPDVMFGNDDSNCITRLAKNNDELIIMISPERIISRRERGALAEFEESIRSV